MSVIIDTGRIVILSDIGAPVVVDIGSPGTDGIGVPAGGTTGQALTKVSGTDYDTEWSTPAGGGDLLAANNLSDLADAATARTNLGLGTAATTAASAYATAAQGAKADTAVQPAAIATKLDDLSAGTADAIVTASADGTLLSRAAYTIATLLAAARDRATHTGTQLAATISDFASAALSAVTWSTLTGKPATFAPASHAASHQSGGGDAIKLDDLAAPDDNTDLNATTGAHGLLPKLGGGTTDFLRADGTWAAPAGGSPGGSSGQLQYNNAGAFGGMAGSSWASNQLLLTAQAAATTPLAVRAAASHSANIQEWQNSSGTALCLIRADGSVQTPRLYGSSGSGGISYPSGVTSLTNFNGQATLGVPNSGYAVTTVGFGFGAFVYSVETSLVQIAAAILGIRGASTGAGAALSFIEQTAPSAPATNGVYIYAEDNGSGKTRLMARFATGAAQQIAIEP